MDMREERLRVLNLVEEGKITVDDATKLLEALSISASMEEEGTEGNDFEKKLSAFAKNAETFARECGSKVGDAYRVVEPKFRKVSKVVLAKTASVVDDLAKTLNESLSNMKDDECGDKCCDEACCCADEAVENCCEGEACDCGCDDEPKEN